MDYETMRQFADTWGLVALFVGFVGIIAFVFRPGSRSVSMTKTRKFRSKRT